MGFTVNGVPFDYWPISGLVEGHTSDILLVRYEVEQGWIATISATPDPRIRVFYRRAFIGHYTNLDVPRRFRASMFETSDVAFIDLQFYVQALAPISGLERVPVSVSIGTGGPARWGLGSSIIEVAGESTEG
jgi:hypothetical protein